MDSLPNEIIQHILSFLSQRYVAVASLVCKKWLVTTRHKRFYQIIYIYSAKQLKKFLDIATTLKIANKNTPIGHFVSEINIEIIVPYTIASYNNEVAYHYSSVDSKQLERLYNSCPNLAKILGLDLEIPNSYAFPQWPYLTIIPLWYSYTNESLSFHKQHNIITSLEYNMRYNDSNSDNNNDDNNSNNYNNDIIQVQMDYPISVFSESSNLLINDRARIQIHRKSIFFSTPSSWGQLKALSLRFGTFIQQQSTPLHKFDERVFNTINSTCPHLESLALYDFYMNLSDDYLPALTTTATTINEDILSHSSLKRLHFNSSILHDSQCFDYVSKLYPNITDLKLDLIKVENNSSEYEQYKLSLFNMITGFNCLKKLSADLKNELYEWFIDHPTQLEVLDYPFDLLDIEDFYLTHLQSKSQLLSSPFSSSLLNYQHEHEHNLNRSLAYLRHLTTLTLRLQTDPSDLLQYLHMSSCSTSVSLSITSLKIVCRAKYFLVLANGGQYYNDNDFFIYQWLDAFPNLREFFTSCPSLHTLSLSYINFVYLTTKPTLPSFSPPFKNKNNWNFIIFDMPHLHLDKLELFYIKSKTCIEKSYGNKPRKLIVNEFASTNSFELEKTHTLWPSICMIVNCKSVDILRFENSTW
ncbi:unnamed protein product [Cunninghamella echinulata]